jgi:hypothetical protein
MEYHNENSFCAKILVGLCYVICCLSKRKKSDKSDAIYGNSITNQFPKYLKRRKKLSKIILKKKKTNEKGVAECGKTKNNGAKWKWKK